MINKIKYMRKLNNMTQQELVDYYVLRPSINAWESGLNKPLTSDIIFMSNKFNISTDYLIKNNIKESIIISNLTENQKKVLFQLVECYTK